MKKKNIVKELNLLLKNIWNFDPIRLGDELTVFYSVPNTDIHNWLIQFMIKYD